jgi:hypothetical protein
MSYRSVVNELIDVRFGSKAASQFNLDSSI